MVIIAEHSYWKYPECLPILFKTNHDFSSKTESSVIMQWIQLIPIWTIQPIWKLSHTLEKNILPELAKQVPQISIFIFYIYSA